MTNPLIAPTNGQLPEPAQPPVTQTVPQVPASAMSMVQNQANPPAPQAAQPTQPAQPTPQQAAIAHDTIIGKAFKVLSGQDTNYSVDPQTGQTIATKTQNTPGQFFRNVVAAALVGGAAGSQGGRETAGSPLAAVARGGQAVINRNQQMDQERLARANQEYQNQIRAQDQQMKQAEEQRQAQAFQSEETLRKAQLAAANAETLRTNVLTQGADFKQHQDVAAAGQQHFSDYKAAGLQPIAENIPESEMQQYIKNRPGASTYDWEATGVKIVKGADGNPTYEYTYSAYDPKGKIPVSKGTLEQWKTDGMDKFYPDLFSNVKPGRELSTQQYVALKNLDTKLYNDNLVRQQNNQSEEVTQAKIKASNAEAARDIAEAQKSRQEASEAALGKKQSEQFGIALQHLNDVNGDFSKLKPSDKVIIGESTSKLIPGLQDELKATLNSTDPDSQQKANEIMGQIDQLTRLTTGAFTPQGGTKPSGSAVTGQPTHDQQINTVVQGLLKLSPGDAVTRLNNTPNLAPADRKEIEQKLEQGRVQQAAQTRQNLKTAGKAVIQTLPALIP